MKQITTLRERIKEFRRTKNFTQDQIAAHTGVSRQVVGKIEKGKQRPSIDFLILLITLPYIFKISRAIWLAIMVKYDPDAIKNYEAQH